MVALLKNMDELNTKITSYYSDNQESQEHQKLLAQYVADALIRELKTLEEEWDEFDTSEEFSHTEHDFLTDIIKRPDLELFRSIVKLIDPERHQHILLRFMIRAAEMDANDFLDVLYDHGGDKLLKVTLQDFEFDESPDEFALSIFKVLLDFALLKNKHEIIDNALIEEKLNEEENEVDKTIVETYLSERGKNTLRFLISRRLSQDSPTYDNLDNVYYQFIFLTLFEKRDVNDFCMVINSTPYRQEVLTGFLKAYDTHTLENSRDKKFISSIISSLKNWLNKSFETYSETHDLIDSVMSLHKLKRKGQNTSTSLLSKLILKHTKNLLLKGAELYKGNIEGCPYKKSVIEYAFDNQLIDFVENLIQIGCIPKNGILASPNTPLWEQALRSRIFPIVDLFFKNPEAQKGIENHKFFIDYLAYLLETTLKEPKKCEAIISKILSNPIYLDCLYNFRRESLLIKAIQSQLSLDIPFKNDLESFLRRNPHYLHNIVCHYVRINDSCNIDKLRYLFRLGLNINSKRGVMIHLALLNHKNRNQHLIVQYLLEKLDKEQINHTLDRRDASEWYIPEQNRALTPLLAVLSSDLENKEIIALQLLNKGADYKKKCYRKDSPFYGKSPLSYAIEHKLNGWLFDLLAQGRPKDGRVGSKPLWELALHFDNDELFDHLMSYPTKKDLIEQHHDFFPYMKRRLHRILKGNTKKASSDQSSSDNDMNLDISNSSQSTNFTVMIRDNIDAPERDDNSKKNDHNLSYITQIFQDRFYIDLVCRYDEKLFLDLFQFYFVNNKQPIKTFVFEKIQRRPKIATAWLLHNLMSYQTPLQNFDCDPKVQAINERTNQIVHYLIDNKLIKESRDSSSISFVIKQSMLHNNTDLIDIFIGQRLITEREVKQDKNYPFYIQKMCEELLLAFHGPKKINQDKARNWFLKVLSDGEHLPYIKKDTLRQIINLLSDMDIPLSESLKDHLKENSELIENLIVDRTKRSNTQCDEGTCIRIIKDHINLLDSIRINTSWVLPFIIYHLPNQLQTLLKDINQNAINDHITTETVRKALLPSGFEGSTPLQMSLHLELTLVNTQNHTCDQISLPLIRKGADFLSPNTHNTSLFIGGETPIEYAVRHGYKDFLKKMIESQAISFDGVIDNSPSLWELGFLHNYPTMIYDITTFNFDAFMACKNLPHFIERTHAFLENLSERAFPQLVYPPNMPHTLQKQQEALTHFKQLLSDPHIFHSITRNNPAQMASWLHKFNFFTDEAIPFSTFIQQHPNLYHEWLVIGCEKLDPSSIELAISKGADVNYKKGLPMMTLIKKGYSDENIACFELMKEKLELSIDFFKLPHFAIVHSEIAFANLILNTLFSTQGINVEIYECDLHTAIDIVISDRLSDLKKEALHIHRLHMRMADSNDESSMEKSLVVKANQIFNQKILPQAMPLFEQKVGDNEFQKLETVESEIRRKILYRIYMEEENPDIKIAFICFLAEIIPDIMLLNHETPIRRILSEESDLNKSHLLKEFIKENISNLIQGNITDVIECIDREDKDRNTKIELLQIIHANILALCQGNHKGLMDQFRTFANSMENSVHGAWRCYDAWAPRNQRWPNLLVFQESDTQAFTIHMPGDGVSIRLASKDCRLRAACYFLLNPKNEYFPHYINEVVRGHSAPFGEDDPACYPGTLTRIARIGQGIEGCEVPESSTEAMMRFYNGHFFKTFTEYLIGKNEEESRDLYDALFLFTNISAERVIENSDMPEAEAMGYPDDIIEQRNRFKMALGTFEQNWQRMDAVFLENDFPKMENSDIVRLECLYADLGGFKRAARCLEIVNQHVENMKAEPWLNQFSRYTPGFDERRDGSSVPPPVPPLPPIPTSPRL